ncbi:PepSY domain-containing protein [Comamonas sp. J-3]|uniref:PepSY domain-containing protein n=1 Tax=Comamonas trifloxystrobinivorans TaxID=3350256 RepID=UPI0037291D5C
MKLSPKRWLYLTHRWLGIALCLLFAMWFASGVVMMYVGYPKLTAQERLAHLPALPADAALLTPQQALDRAGWQQPLQELRLNAGTAGKPVYVLTPSQANKGHAGGQHATVIDATSGELLREVDANTALASAAAWASQSAEPAQTLHYQGTVQEDAATHSRALDAHRPLHVVALADGTWLYISSRSGDVVRDATRSERAWNYAGAWIHWLYPLRGGALDKHWTNIVIWLSVLGTLGAISGSVIGIWRWRFAQPYRSGRRTPYPSRSMRWHHISGLLFAAITLTWIFSGLMSMNPWKVFNSGAAPVQTAALHGKALGTLDASATPAQLLQAAGPDTRELRWLSVLGQPLVLAYGSSTTPQVLDARSAQAHTVDADALRAALPKLLAAPITRVEVLNDYDLYYYARTEHSMTGGGDKPLPIWRAVFGDEHQTWVHLDPHTGAVLGSVDSRRRIYRWLFAMLHSWDWLPLLERRPLWDAVLIALSLGGLLLSVTGTVVGWRRLRQSLRR